MTCISGSKNYIQRNQPPIGINNLQQQINNFKDYGLKFDGVNDCVQVPSSASLKITGELTMFFKLWLNQTNGTQCIAAKGRGRQRMYDVTLHNHELLFRHGDGMNHSQYSIKIPFQQFNSQFVTVAWVKPTNNTTTAQIYVNGNPQSFITVSNGLFSSGTNNHKVQIGDFPDGYFPGVAPLNGYIFDLKIYNKVLTPTQISDLHQGNKPSAVNSNLKLHLDFQEQSGWVAIDHSGNNNNGTLIRYTTSDVSLGVDNSHVNSQLRPF